MKVPIRRPKNKKKDPLASQPPTVADGETLRFTDLSNAEKFVQLYGADFRFVSEWGAWMFWDGAHWQRDDRSATHARRAAVTTVRVIARETTVLLDDDAAALGFNGEKPARAWAKRSQTAPRIAAMLTLASADCRLSISVKALDSNPMLFNVKNGTLDLKTQTLRPHSRADYITKVAEVDYSVDAPAPRWKAFLATILPDVEARSFLQRYLGYALTGDVGERMLVVLHGRGRNGKSLFLRTVQEVFGPYATTTASTLLMAKENDAHPTEVADLFGVRLAVSSEVKKGHVFDEEAVKRLTGNDRLKARRMREDFWEFNPTFKLIIAANHKPRVRDTSDSFWDRLALVTFGVRIPAGKVDPRLLQKLVHERAGILSWLVDGLASYRRIGLKPPAAVRKATTEYREREDWLRQFFDECSVMDAGSFTLTSELMQSIDTWAKQHGFRSPNSNALGERLRELGCTRGRTSNAKGWHGIRIRAQKRGPSGHASCALTAPVS